MTIASDSLLNANYILAIKTERVPIQICTLLNMHNLFITEEFASVENLDSKMAFKTHKIIFYQKENQDCHLNGRSEYKTMWEIHNNEKNMRGKERIKKWIV